MAQEGFLYEENAYNALKKYKISTGGTAGASSDKPDLTIQAKVGRAMVTTGCELKNSPTAAGSLVLKYVDGKWAYGDTGEDSPEKDFLKNLGIEADLLRKMTSKYKGLEPMLQNTKDGKKKLKVGNWSVLSHKEKAYKQDLKTYGGSNELHIDVGAKAVCDYYLKKKCSYINIGTHGFFTLNGVDSLSLNHKLTSAGYPMIPNFAENAECKIRVRVQLKSSSKKDYQFVMTLQFSGVKKSPYNIAPIRAGSKSSIDTNKLKSDPLISAFT
jgi:hypothetical protein